MKIGGTSALCLLAVFAVALAFAAHAGCSREGCLAGKDAACIVPPPCDALSFTCAPGATGIVSSRIIGEGDVVPGGLDALGAAGDIMLSNDRIVAVIDALDHPNFVAPTGGAILDLSTVGDDNDSLNHLFHGTGLLPEDAASYTEMMLLEGDGFRAVQFRGHLDGHPEQTIATRYEVRPCEPGVRVRTELVNGEPDAAIWTLTDAWYWSGRETLPFTPFPGAGFVHPSFELTDIGEVFRSVPFMAASGHSTPSAAYSIVACNAPSLEGFQASTISATGTKRRIVAPRDYVVFERFIGVANGNAIAPAVDVALEVRRQLFGESHVTVKGRIVSDDPDAAIGTENRAAIVISEGDLATPKEKRIPWSEAVPEINGTFSLTVPAERSHVLELFALGELVSEREIRVDRAPVDLGDIMLAPVGRVSVAVHIDGVMSDALVFFHPADEATRRSTTRKLLGGFVECAPLLGPPYGGSPACNRVLTRDRVAIEVPRGRYQVYATAGPFATIQRQTLQVEPGTPEQALRFELSSLPLMPSGVLSADFHVHGGLSFDSSIPDRARVQAFLAAGIDVIAATDHDAVSDYADAMDALGARDRLVLMTGVETTGHILFDYVPDSDFPKVIGHWNFWPIPYRPTAPRNGAPIDDRLEPGALFDRLRASGFEETGVIQLNHPLSDSDLGRDLGFAEAIDLDLGKPLPKSFDGTGPSLFLRTPPGSQRSNASYHTQEVMNGTDNEHYLRYRALWFYLLDQGIVRAGTANSDSHGLADNVLGTPRNLVWTTVTKRGFDADAFNADVKLGRIVGTNGPVIEAFTIAKDDVVRRPSIEPFEPAPAAKLVLKVSAAPWVPIEEVRIVVNGVVARTLKEVLSHPSDPFGRNGLVRLEMELDLAELLPPGDEDAWLVVEAGAPLLEAADLDCDHVPDTSDNDQNGVIDWRDVDRNDDDQVDDADLDVNEDGKVDGADVPEVCDPDQDVGPLRRAAAIPEDDPLFLFDAVTPGGDPASFTNPLLFDRDGGGFKGPGVRGGRAR